MTQVLTSKVGRLALVAGVAALLAPAAHAQGGAVSHVYAPPPLDAGSAVPNPDYTQAGRSGAVRPDDRANRGLVHGKSIGAAVSSSGDGFDWGEAGIGAGGALALLLAGAGATITLRRNRRSAASA
jgi:hypothetical protein